MGEEFVDLLGGTSDEFPGMNDTAQLAHRYAETAVGAEPLGQALGLGERRYLGSAPVAIDLGASGSGAYRQEWSRSRSEQLQYFLDRKIWGEDRSSQQFWLYQYLFTASIGLGAGHMLVGTTPLVEDALRPVALRMSLPRWALARMRDVLWMLLELRQPPGPRSRRRMFFRPGFAEALTLLAMDLEARDCGDVLLSAWQAAAADAGAPTGLAGTDVARAETLEPMVADEEAGEERGVVRVRDARKHGIGARIEDATRLAAVAETPDGGRERGRDRSRVETVDDDQHHVRTRGGERDSRPQEEHREKRSRERR